MRGVVNKLDCLVVLADLTEKTLIKNIKIKHAIQATTTPTNWYPSSFPAPQQWLPVQNDILYRV